MENLQKCPDFLKKENAPQKLFIKKTGKISSSNRRFTDPYEDWWTWKVKKDASFDLVKSKITLKHKLRPNGVTVAYQRFRQKSGKPVGVVFNHHGYTGSQNGCCYHSDLLAKEGYDVLGFDQEGHGSSSKPDSNFKNKNTIILTACSFILKMIEIDPTIRNIPIFLWGISMGGLTSLGVSIQNEFYEKVKKDLKGMVVLCPAVITLPINMVDLYKLKTNIEEFAEYLKNEGCEKVKIPFLVFHGTGDGLISHKGSQLLYNKAEKNTKDRTLVEFENAGHSLQTDWCCEIITKFAKFWIMERT